MEFYKNATELRCALSGFVMQEKYIPKKWRPILAYPTVNLLNTMMEHIDDVTRAARGPLSAP